MESSIYGRTPEGDEVKLFKLRSANGVELEVINYGCTITSLKTHDRNGNTENIVLGFDSLEGYLQSPHYIGCMIGRYAGRIAHGKFEINNQPFQLSINDGEHHLHGGLWGFDKYVWDAQSFENEMGNGVDFQFVAIDGEEGYPGNMAVNIRYQLTSTGELMIACLAYADVPTIVNLTQHSYFNLNGGIDSILNHELRVFGDEVLELDATMIPTGKIYSIENTPFDTRNGKSIYEMIKNGNDQVRLARGIDHCWVLNKRLNELGPAASLYDPTSGRKVTVHTSLPGMQVYTGNALTGIGRNGNPLVLYSGVCLEAQYYPDAPNHAHFPSPVILPGSQYRATTIYKFGVE